MDYPIDLSTDGKCDNCKNEQFSNEIKNLVGVVEELESTVNELRNELYMMKKEIIEKD